MRSWFVLLALVGCALPGCTVHSPIPDIDAGPDAGATPADAGRDAARDAGPRPDAGPPIGDVLIYAHSRDRLYTFSPYTNTVTPVGTFRTESGEPAPFMLDLAVDAEGIVFTSSDEALWRVDPETAVVTHVGDFGLGRDQLFALSFLAPEESPDGSEMLVGATNEGVYYEVDRNDASTRRLGHYPEGWRSSGDIVSVDGLGTFATLRHQDFPDADVLARILFSSDGRSVVTVIGPIEDGSTGFTEVFGLGYWGRNLYGFTNRGQLIRIDRTTGDASIVATSTGASQFWGAGVTVAAPVLF